MLVLDDSRSKDRKYLDWVKRQPSVISGLPADDPHHVVGHGFGGMGIKAGDYFSFPLTRQEHTMLHDMGYESWEKRYGSQVIYALKTLEGAVRMGFFSR